MPRCQRSFVPARDDSERIHRLRTFEDSCQAIIIFLGQRVVFVVVTTGTSHRHPHHRPCDGVDLFVDDVHLHLDRIIFRQHLSTQTQKACGNDSIKRILFAECPASTVRRCVVRFQQIPGDLFHQEPVIRLVFAHRLDDIIAIAKRVRKSQVFVQPIRIGITSHIEPVTGPPFAVAGRSQKTVHKSLVRIVRDVADEFRDVVRCWYESRQVNRHPANQGSFFSLARNRQTFGFQFRQDESIDGRTSPLHGSHIRWNRMADRLKRPERSLLVAETGLNSRCWLRYRAFRIRPGNATTNPFGQSRDFCRRQFCLRWHLHGVPITDDIDQQRFFGFAHRLGIRLRRVGGAVRWNNDDRRSTFAPFQQAFSRVESQTGFRLVAAVAFQTFRHQKRSNPGFKKCVICRFIRQRLLREKNEHDPNQT